MDIRELVAKLEQENAELKAQIRVFLSKVERLDAYIHELLEDI